MSAYTAIASQTLTSSASSVTFSSIPGTFRDLVLISMPIASAGFSIERYRFNNDDQPNYNVVSMRSNGTSQASSTRNATTLLTEPDFGAIQTISGAITMTEILDYSQTNKHKSVLIKVGNSQTSNGPFTAATAGRWSQTAAITNIQISCSSGEFSAGSTFSLYGVSA